MNRPHSHCPDCGAQLPTGDWPKSCTACSTPHFLNPTPVSVLLQPVGEGLLTVRRAIDPGRGELAIPGGFIDLNESWQQAAVRELHEETGVVVDAEDVEAFDVLSAPDGTVLIFGIAPKLDPAVVADFRPTNEVSELVVVDEVQPLAFPLHTEVLTRWIAA